MVGAAAAAGVDTPTWWRVVPALVVSLALQIGVNFANDYSDGVRGTDTARVGPVRLVASGLASPAAVKRAAFIAFAVALVAGGLLVLAVGWELIPVGVAAVLSAWFYTGGPKPYGYLGLGEVFVFVFFGLVATAGTTYVIVERLTWLAVAAGCGTGALACALLVVNNLRDIPTDSVSGKRTLAVRLGDTRTRSLYIALVAAAFVAVALCALDRPPALVGLAAIVAAVPPIAAIRRGATGRELIPVLGGTGRLQIVYGVLFAAGLALGA
jgi:1,4-dihydroxy-2-naphthoate octaprenyltransferase